MRPNLTTVAMLAALTLAPALETACRSSKAQNREAVPARNAEPPAAPAGQGSTRPTPFRNPPRAAEVIVPAETALQVRLDHAVTTDGNRPGDRFTGSVVKPVTVNGQVVIPAGASVQGVVKNAAPSGRLKGRAVLTLGLHHIAWRGHSYELETTSYSRTSARHRKRNWAFIGGGSGGGVLIGALAGGGAGALIGGGAGAAAGAVTAAVTGKRQVRLPAESLITFKTRRPLAVRGMANTSRLEKEKL